MNMLNKFNEMVGLNIKQYLAQQPFYANLPCYTICASFTVFSFVTPSSVRS